MMGYMHWAGKGIEQDYAKAIEYYEKSAKEGNTTALNNIGNLYKSGLGVKQDYKKAFEYYEKCAKTNNVIALNNLGMMYEKGLGVEQDYKKALEYYKISSEKGNEAAMNNLAIMYYKGIEVKKDLTKAAEIFLNGAEKGNSYAFFNLGLLYKKGEGVSKDLNKSIYNFYCAFKLGHPSAEDQVKKLVSESKEIDWKQEYHIYWNSIQNGVQLNEQILLILLISKFRKTSIFPFIFSFVKGIAINIIKFICNFKQEIKVQSSNFL